MHLFVDNLTNVDFSYLDSQRGLVGETWLASIALDGALDEQGMVCDFGIVKKTVRHWLDTYIDHCLVVASQSSSVHFEQNHQESIDLSWTYGSNTLRCVSPKQAIALVDHDSITPESVASWCIAQLRELLPDTIDKITLTFTPEVISHHFYHYSHGLKKHLGNCQRIAHGHRSTLQIMKNNVRDHDLEQQWCQKWQDIYIGTQDDLVATPTINGVEHYHFAYDSQQGHFELTIAADNCDLIETDSTVEWIAQHIATQLKQQHPQHKFSVRAYEGIGKGAIAHAQ